MFSASFGIELRSETSKATTETFGRDASSIAALGLRAVPITCVLSFAEYTLANSSPSPRLAPVMTTVLIDILVLGWERLLGVELIGDGNSYLSDRWLVELILWRAEFIYAIPLSLREADEGVSTLESYLSFTLLRN